MPVSVTSNSDVSENSNYTRQIYYTIRDLFCKPRSLVMTDGNEWLAYRTGLNSTKAEVVH